MKSNYATMIFALKMIAACALITGAAGPLSTAFTQKKLEVGVRVGSLWAVPPWLLWASEECKKRTNDKFEIQILRSMGLARHPENINF